MPYVSLNKNPRIKIIIGTALVLVLAVFVFVKSNLDPKHILDSLSKLDPTFLLLSLVMSLLQVLFWILRPWPLLPAGSKLPFLNLAKAISIGQFLNAFAPARAGDVSKVILLSSSKIHHPLKPTTAVALLATDKVVDIVAIVLLALFSGATEVDTQSFSGSVSFALFLLIPVIFYAVWFFLNVQLKERIKNWWNEFVVGLKPLLSPKLSLISLLFALAVWVAEALAMLLILKAAGHSIAFSQSVYLMCIVNLGILVPISFANVGAYEAAFVYGVSKFGIGMETGVALAIAQHSLQALAMTLWAVSLFRVGGKIKLN